MRTMLLIAAAGLTGLLGGTSPVRAHYYGWGYYRPYFPVPYGYYPEPYYAPPPRYDAPPRRIHRAHPLDRIWHRIGPRRPPMVQRTLVNPLLGPLPGATMLRRN